MRGLGEHFDVEHIAYADCGGKLRYLRELRARLDEGGARAVLLWFLAPAYSLETMALAHRRGRPVAVAAGGLEVDYVPELKLGGLKWPHNRLRQKLGLRKADLVISDSEFLAGRIRKLASPRRLETVYMGVDVERFTPAGAKEPLVLSVCFSITRETALLKGLPTLVEAARLLPEVEFVVVGRSGGDDALDELAARAPANVSFTGRFVGDDELLGLYRRASVYAQVSAHEAFGVAVAEAMACGCIPVAARGSALQEVAGPVAHDVDYGDAAATADAIRAALGAPESDRAAARARVVERYPIGRRIERLAELLSPLLR